MNRPSLPCELVLVVLAVVFGLGSQCNQGDDVPLTSSGFCGACMTVDDCARGNVEVQCIAGRCQVPCATSSDCASTPSGTCAGGYCGCGASDGGADAGADGD